MFLPLLIAAVSNVYPKVALKERGIEKLLDEAREDTKENDAIHMRRK
jgi:hypothetical protein